GEVQNTEMPAQQQNALAPTLRLMQMFQSMDLQLAVKLVHRLPPSDCAFDIAFGIGNERIQHQLTLLFWGQLWKTGLDIALHDPPAPAAKPEKHPANPFA